VRHESCSTVACAASDPGGFELTNCTIADNVAADGGGISVVGWSPAALEGSAVLRNSAFGSGGGILYHRTSDAAAGQAESGMMVVAGCAVAGNSAQHRDSGGLAVLNGGVRVEDSNFSGNTARQGSGGGLAIGGFPYGGPGSVWAVADSHFQSDWAGRSGGAISSSGLFYHNEIVSSGSGIPFALQQDGAVLCRGRDAFDDRNVVVFRPENSTNETLLDPSELVFLESDALVAGVSSDGSLVIMLLNWQYTLVVINTSSGQIMKRHTVPPKSAFARISEVAGSLSKTLPVFVPKITDTNYCWYYVYGGWGPSSVAVGDITFVSTFHSTIAFSASENSFEELRGCESGVTAMTLPGSILRSRVHIFDIQVLNS
jgi:hypothetical protein